MVAALRGACAGGLPSPVNGLKRDRLMTLSGRIAEQPRVSLAQLPTPLHPLQNYSRLLGLDLWIKRDDLTGLVGGGNKTRKLEFLVGDALRVGADTLVTIGALQSNHTRQTAAAAARSGLRCVLLHSGWTRDAGEFYRQTGNILLSSLMGAELYVDETPRPIDDQSPLTELTRRLEAEGRRVYAIPGGASEHPLGSLGYMVCAAEIVQQAEALGRSFDYIVHCTGSSSTQAGLLAGLRTLGVDTRVVGIADDEETLIKQARVRKLANDSLALLGLDTRVSEDDVTVIAVDQSTYGVADARTLDSIRQFATAEGLMADPVYEGKALRGLRDLAEQGYFEAGSRILLMHLGGTPAVHAYANQFGTPQLRDINARET
jgi:1-aminocyclopropane-1-carboxylate deaminase